MAALDTDVDPLALERQVCFALAVTNRAVLAVYRPLLEPLGLTHPQYLVMLALWTDGPLSVGDLGRRLRLDSGTLTPLLKRLEASGRVERHRDPHDERRVVVSPAPDAEQLRRDVAEAPREVARSIGLGAEEFAQLQHLLSDLIDNLDGIERPA